MKLTQAGQFDIPECTLITSTGNIVPVQESILELTLYEGIYENSLYGEVQILNDIALSNKGPFIGQEYMKLVVLTPTLKDSTHQLMFNENVFHVTKVGRTEAAGVEILTLEFYSTESIHNQRTLLSRAFKGEYHKMVEDILRNDLKCRKRLYIEKTNDIKEHISNNVHPFDLIKSFTTQSTAKTHGLSSYVFYENLRGYHFRSLQSLYAEGSRFTYVQTDANTTPGDPGDPRITGMKTDDIISVEMTKILGVKVLDNNDVATTFGAGGLSSRLITHDIVQKKFNVNTYNYLDDTSLVEQGLQKYATRNAGPAGKIKDAPLYNKSKLDEEGNRISDFIPIQYLAPVTTVKNKEEVYKNSQYEVYNENLGQTEFIFDPVKIETTLQKRRSLFANLETGINIELWVNGNTTFGAGDIISVNIKKKSDDNDDPIDDFVRNEFLVKSVKHVFNRINKKHYMYLVVTKDSKHKELEVSDHVEPKPFIAQPLYDDDNFYGDEAGYDEDGKNTKVGTIKIDF